MTPMFRRKIDLHHRKRKTSPGRKEIRSLERKRNRAVSKRQVLIGEGNALERDVLRWQDKLETRKLRGRVGQFFLSPERANRRIADLRVALGLTDIEIAQKQRLIEGLEKRIIQLEERSVPIEMRSLAGASRAFSVEEKRLNGLREQSKALRTELERWKKKQDARKSRGKVLQFFLSPKRAERTAGGLEKEIISTNREITRQEKLVDNLRERIKLMDKSGFTEGRSQKVFYQAIDSAHPELIELREQSVALHEKIAELKKAREELATSIVEAKDALEKRKEEGLVADDHRLTRAKHWFLQKWYHHTELHLKAAHHAGVRGNFDYVRDFARKSSCMEDIVQMTDFYLKGVNESRFFELHEKRALTIDALLFVAQYGEPEYLSGRMMESINVKDVLRFVCETEGQRNEDAMIIVGRLIEHCGNKWLNRLPNKLLSDLVNVLEGFPEEARQHEGMIMSLADAAESKLKAQRDFTEYNARVLRQLKTFFSTRT